MNDVETYEGVKQAPGSVDDDRSRVHSLTRRGTEKRRSVDYLRRQSDPIFDINVRSNNLSKGGGHGTVRLLYVD